MRSFPWQYFADLVVLADGPNSNFRSQFTTFRPQSQSRFWGLELSDVELPIDHYAYGILGSGPPLLVYKIGSGETRILIDIFNDTHLKLGGQDVVRSYIAEQVLPIVPENLQAGLHYALKKGRLRSMPNSWMAAARNRDPGLLMLGDCSNMRHPMTGAGMTVAIKDAILLSDLLKPEVVPSFRDADLVLRKLGEFHWKRKYHSASLNILAQALYLLFASEGICRDPGCTEMNTDCVHSQNSHDHAEGLHHFRPRWREELWRRGWTYGWRNRRPIFARYLLRSDCNIQCLVALKECFGTPVANSDC